MAAEQRQSPPPTVDERSGHWLNLSAGPGVEAASSETAGAKTNVDLQSGATLSTDLTVSAVAGAVFDVAAAITDDVSGCIDPHIETDSVANPEATNGTRFKKVRKAESLGTTTAESLEVPEKKMRRADGVFLVERRLALRMKRLQLLALRTGRL